jgi:hypothetical protein
MSNTDDIEVHVEEIVAEIVAGGLRDPAWIANAYIERIDPDRRLPDLINGACAAYVLRDALDARRRHADELRLW